MTHKTEDNKISVDKSFPLFQIIPEFEGIYTKHCVIGEDFLKDKILNVTGLARNVGDKLEKNILAINNLSEKCKQINYFIYENDSSDNTVSILEKLKNNLPSFNYLSENLNLQKFGSVKDKNRTLALAKHRNTCLKFIQKNHSDADFTLVSDLDFEVISLFGMLNSFGFFCRYDSIDAIAGNSFQIQASSQKPNNKRLWNYDSWAFRGTWWDDLQNYTNYFKSSDPMLWFGYWHPPIGSSPIQVNSAFGGLCIYRNSKFLQGVYSGEDCEHVCFHKTLRESCGFSLFLNPSQIMVV